MHAGEEGIEGGAVAGESWTGVPNMPGRWLLPLEAGSQPRLNLPLPLTDRPPAITDGSVRRQPDNLSGRRRQILGV
jgi:hypothetical protein